MMTLDYARLVEGLREVTAGFAGAVAGGDPEAKVPTCPEWRLARLVGHIGQADRWAAGIVREGGPSAVPDPAEADHDEPAAWEDRLLGGAEELIAAMRDAGAETEVWSMAGPVPAAFWVRRMMCDTAVHHYDAALTTGAAYGIAGDVAAEVLTESLQLIAATEAAEAFLPRLAALRGRGERLVIRPDGVDGWVITRTPEGVRWERGDGDGDVVVSGTTAECMLVFARRLPARAVTGDRAVLEHWLAHTAF
ncbi:maleylpyruvate isomerase family mycothiol-dependent enzyme [Nonomuraea fuscirosea]|uniref:maleylpyruvate isomerase family mycothiol-dependent enzyme n=1 Tax=Nonomuraea fuscirosea TaxID=1291556 RepID=UPI00344619D8